MTTSGTTTYSVNETTLIQDAYETATIYEAGSSVSPDDYALARRKLNMIAKQLSGSSDYSPGLKMWARKTGYLFLAKNTGSYSFGPSGDHCTESYAQTTLASNAAGGASTVVVSSATGIANTYYIGIELDSGTLQWTTVNGAPSGTTVTLTATLTSAASSGNAVFCYQTKARNPIEILSVVRRTSAGLDNPMGFTMSLEQYESIQNKERDGVPTDSYWQYGLTNSTVKIDYQPSDATDVLRVVFLSPAEDYSATTDTIEYPQTFYRYLSALLARDLCIAFGKVVSPDLKELIAESGAIAKNFHSAGGEYFFEPDRT